MQTQMVDGIPEVSPEEMVKQIGKVKIIDVRRPDEFTGELGHIAGSQLITLGPELASAIETLSKDETVVFVCRSGGRSREAAKYAMTHGISKVASLTGGMLAWRDKNLPAQR